MIISKYLKTFIFSIFYWKIWFTFYLFFLYFSSQGLAQNFLKYKIQEVFIQKSFPDSLLREDFLNDLLLSLQLKGYPNPNLSQRTFHADTLTVIVNAGEFYEWIYLKKGNLEESLANKVGFEERDFRNRPFNYQKLTVLFERVLNETENSGYPFATIRLDSIAQQMKGISAVINLDLGPFISFDSIQVTGNSKTDPLFLNRFLNMMPGTAFSQKKVDQSMGTLKNLPFLQLANDPQISFQNQAAILYLPINDRPINTLDGIIGILPNEIDQNKILVTGEFHLALYNVAGRGRNYSLNWQRMNQLSQSLKISAEEPMLLGSMIDLKVSYYLLKEDSTYINRDFRVDFGYRTSPNTYLGFFSRRQSGDLLAVSQWAREEKLPNIADFRYNNYGINFLWNKLDDVFWPRRGWRTEIEWGIGNKRLVQNTGLPVDLYHDLEMNSIQYYFTLSMEKHVYLRRNLGLMWRMASGEMANEHLLLNDLYRLGGLKSIRGFNENFFFANRYVYVSFEPRYYFDNRSYFLLFTDIGGLQNNVETVGMEYPFAFGGGLSLESNGGIFHFIYAMGQSNTQVLGFNFSKIHFGFTGRF